MYPYVLYTFDFKAIIPKNFEIFLFFFLSLQNWRYQVSGADQIKCVGLQSNASILALYR